MSARPNAYGRSPAPSRTIMSLGSQTRSDALLVMLLTCAATVVSLYDLLLLALSV